MGYRIRIVSQSNSGVDALTGKVTDAVFGSVSRIVAMAPQLQHLQNKIVRLTASSVEKISSSELDALKKRGTLSPQDRSMAACIHREVQANPKDGFCLDFTKHVDAMLDSSKKPPKRPWGTVVANIKARILRDALMLAGTAFACTNLNSIDLLPPHILMFDEAGQATEADFLMAITNANQLYLVIIAGHPNQLGPVVMSLQTKRNPYAAIMAMSILDRVRKGFPKLVNIPLRTNYRCHPSITQMASKVFYDQKMRSTRLDARWNTAVADNIFKMLGGPAFAQAFRNNSHSTASLSKASPRLTRQQSPHTISPASKLAPSLLKVS